MPKNRVIYNQIGTFVGPCPSTGYHFLTSGGVPTNNDNPETDFNLVFPLNRIVQASYGFSESRTDLKSLGYYGTLARPVTNHDVNLSLSFYQAGLINERRLGFTMNFPSSNTSTGTPIYNNRVIPISGFLDRNYNSGSETSLGWPLSTTDERNIFIATKQNYDDLNNTSSSPDFQTSCDVFSFGNCFLNSYRTNGGVGQISKVSVDFTCNNIEFYNYGSGKNIPSVNPKDFTIIPNKTFSLPNNFQGTGLPTVLIPSDITVDINRSDNSVINNVPISFSDIKIQNYSIDLSLPRDPLYNLGYRLPIDRRINLPVYSNLNFNVIVGDSQTGSLINITKDDKEYDIKLKLRYQSNSFRNDGIAVQYDFIGAKLNDMNISESISNHRVASFSFTSEINPINLNKGFFMSGQLGIQLNTGNRPNY
jgi:hypothetical protein